MLTKLGIKADRFDLHCHTPASDGSRELIDLLLDAEKAQLDVISFTDHDTLEIYDQLQDIDPKKFYSGIILNGVEITCELNGERVEVLAYNFDLKKLKKYKFFKKAYDKKIVERQIKKLTAKVRKMGFVCNPEESRGNRVSIWEPVYLSIMHNKKENKDLIKKYNITDAKNFCRVLFSQKDQPFYIKATYAPTIKKIYKIVHKCGGVCIFAHPYNYNLKEIDKHLTYLVDNKIIDGIECAHSSHTKAQIKHLVNFCDQHCLMKTAGSDFHGRERYYENGLYTFAFGYLGSKKELQPITAKMIGYKFGE